MRTFVRDGYLRQWTVAGGQLSVSAEQ